MPSRLSTFANRVHGADRTAGSLLLRLTRVICCATGLQLALPDVAAAAGLREFDISNEGNSYTIHLDIVIDVPPDYVRDVLTDYRHIYRLNPSIVDSRILPAPDDGVSRVYTRMEGCILFYCSDLARVEDVSVTGSGELIAVIVPGMSDFGPGETVWRISRHGHGSRLLYESRLQPKAFIPPLLGSLLVRKKLREEILTTLQHIECNARMRQLIAEAESTSAADRLRYGLCRLHLDQDRVPG